MNGSVINGCHQVTQTNSIQFSAVEAPIADHWEHRCSSVASSSLAVVFDFLGVMLSLHLHVYLFACFFFTFWMMYYVRVTSCKHQAMYTIKLYRYWYCLQTSSDIHNKFVQILFADNIFVKMLFADNIFVQILFADIKQHIQNICTDGQCCTTKIYHRKLLVNVIMQGSITETSVCAAQWGYITEKLVNAVRRECIT